MRSAPRTDYQSAAQSLRQYGPERDVTVAGARAHWFEVDADSKDNFGHGADFGRGYVMADWASQSQPYLLCYDDTTRALTHSTEGGRKPWTVQASHRLLRTGSQEARSYFHSGSMRSAPSTWGT